MTPAQKSANWFTMACTPLVGISYPWCPACDRLVPELYGGPSDRLNDGTDPCPECVLRSFAEHG